MNIYKFSLIALATTVANSSSIYCKQENVLSDADRNLVSFMLRENKGYGDDFYLSDEWLQKKENRDKMIKDLQDIIEQLNKKTVDNFEFVSSEIKKDDNKYDSIVEDIEREFILLKEAKTKDDIETHTSKLIELINNCKDDYAAKIIERIKMELAKKVDEGMV